MEAETCVICNRETSDPLLWPPEAKTRIVVCESCFTELLDFSDKLSPTPLTIAVSVGTESEARIEQPDPVSQADTKNRRLHTRWVISKEAKMTWLVDQGAVFTTVQLVDGSENGLGVRSPRAVDVGRDVRLKLGDASTFRGDVRYCLPVNGGFRLGVRLKNVRLLQC